MAGSSNVLTGSSVHNTTIFSLFALVGNVACGLPRASWLVLSSLWMPSKSCSWLEVAIGEEMLGWKREIQQVEMSCRGGGCSSSICLGFLFVSV
ncbi:unnamed protein product [Malus baccata var. baccata]